MEAAVGGARRAPHGAIGAATERPAPVVGARVQFVDACRGLAVIGMLLANLVNVFLTDIPGPLSHNQGDSLRLFDLPAPVFQFLVGVSLQLFLQARTAAGRSLGQAQREALRRFTLLILLGMLLDGLGAFSPLPRWGVLQTLGLGGILATLLAALPPATAVLVALGLLAIFSGAMNGTVHGNPGAALAFAPLTIVGLLVGRSLRRDAERTAAAIALVTLGLALVLFRTGVPFNKVLGTSSFVALSSAVAATAIAALAWVEHRGRAFPAWLLGVGRNALTAWVILYAFVYYPAWLAFPSWERLPVVPGLATALVTTVALCVATVALGRRGIRVPL